MEVRIRSINKTFYSCTEKKTTKKTRKQNKRKLYVQRTTTYNIAILVPKKSIQAVQYAVDVFRSQYSYYS